jgi:Protein of unknown function (DUF2911)
MSIASHAIRLLVAGALPAVVAAHPRSQLAVVAQSVASARIEIVYRRPVARGRSLFGYVVPWGAIWTPSADTAARFTTSGPLEINGATLAAGSYSLWAIPDSTSWTLIFNSINQVFHLRYPQGHDVLRVTATPARGEFVETLLFAFPMVDADSARLELRWGTTVVPFTIRAR